VNDTVAVFLRKLVARLVSIIPVIPVLLAGGVILTIGGYQFSPRSHAETHETSAAAKPEKVTVMVRGTNGRDEERSFTPGEGKTESFRDCIDSACTIKGPKMVVVPAGNFMMGATLNENGEKDEKPQHKVTIAKPFAVGKFAVTRDEFETFVTETGYKMDGGCYTRSGGEWKGHTARSFRSPGFLQDGTHPVVCVNWNDAQAYTAWVSKKTGKSYRLLSEAEREYVTRAGTITPFWSGTSISTDQANYNGNYIYGGGKEGDYRQKTLPVKSFQPNPWGLYQVHGNVWEWVEDCYHEDYNNAPADGSAWVGEKNCRRVLRGGSSNYIPQYLRSAVRDGISAGGRFVNGGFRLARTF
jgi:formylglycine-generating enzyme required for sulfatase activity